VSRRLRAPVQAAPPRASPRKISSFAYHTMDFALDFPRKRSEYAKSQSACDTFNVFTFVLFLHDGPSLVLCANGADRSVTRFGCIPMHPRIVPHCLRKPKWALTSEIFPQFFDDLLNSPCHHPQSTSC